MTATANRKRWSIAVLALALFFAASGSAPALQVGDKAPDFELESSKGGKLNLSSLKGKNV